MSNDSKSVTATEAKSLTTNENVSYFMRKVTTKCILACNKIEISGKELEMAEKEMAGGFQALGANEDGLQKMIAAQLMSLHRLQQISISMANDSKDPHTRQYFTNAAIKLTNAFTNQAALLSKLQGNGDQKVIVKHVDVHNGGQAVVGNINGASVKK